MIRIRKSSIYDSLLVFLVVLFIVVSAITIYFAVRPRYVLPNIYFEPNIPAQPTHQYPQA